MVMTAGINIASVDGCIRERFLSRATEAAAACVPDGVNAVDTLGARCRARGTPQGRDIIVDARDAESQ